MLFSIEMEEVSGEVAFNSALDFLSFSIAFSSNTPGLDFNNFLKNKLSSFETTEL